jgi:hypothetical protein
MKTKHFRFNRLFILPALMALALTGCSTSAPPSKPFSSSSYDQRSDFGGELVTDSVSKTATVVSVDRARRLIVLKRPNGSEVAYKALPNAAMFDEVKAGDAVKVTVAEELAVFLGKNNVPSATAANAAKLHVRLPGSTQAVAAEGGTVPFTAKVTALNDWNDTATLQLPDGTIKTIRVSEAVNLADVSIGDAVSVQATESAVVLLEKP